MTYQKIASQACKQCELHEHLDTNSEEYQKRRADDITCKANFKGLKWNLKVSIVYLSDLWNINDNLRYTEYYGDGHSKSFTKLKDAYQASGITVPKKSALIMCRKG